MIHHVSQRLALAIATAMSINRAGLAPFLYPRDLAPITSGILKTRGNAADPAEIREHAGHRRPGIQSGN